MCCLACESINSCWIELNWIESLCLRRYCCCCVSEQTVLKFLDKFHFKITSTFQNIKPYVLLYHFSYFFVSVNRFSSYWYSNKYSRAGTCLQWFTRRTFSRRHSSAATLKRHTIILWLCIFLLSDTHSPTEIFRKFQVVFRWRNIWTIFLFFFLWSTLLTLEHIL